MARVSNVLIGKTSGSVGGTTFSSWKGINVLKSKPTVVANPKSDKQLAQRAAFSFMVALYRIITGVVRIGFKELAIGKSEFNAFTGANLKSAFDLSSPPDATFLPENLKISKGTISDTDFSVGPITTATLVAQLEYPLTASLPGQSATDKPLVVVYNETKDQFYSEIPDATRADGTANVSLPQDWEANDELRFYLGFASADGSAASDSTNKTATIQGGS